MLGKSERAVLSFLDKRRVAQLDIDAGHTVSVLLKRPLHYEHSHNYSFEVASVGIFLLEECRRLIIVETDGTSLLTISGSTPQEIAVAIIRDWVRSFRMHEQLIGNLFDQLHNSIKNTANNKELLRLFVLAKSLMMYSAAISTNSDVISTLLDSFGEAASIVSKQLIEQISLENSQCLNLAQTLFDVNNELMDASSSVVANNLNLITENQTIILISHG